ncbi:hypothetical protein GCM10010520_44260 [Rhizobium viscosum]
MFSGSYDRLRDGLEMAMGSVLDPNDVIISARFCIAYDDSRMNAPVIFEVGKAR